MGCACCGGGDISETSSIDAKVFICLRKAKVLGLLFLRCTTQGTSSNGRLAHFKNRYRCKLPTKSDFGIVRKMDLGSVLPVLEYTRPIESVDIDSEFLACNVAAEIEGLQTARKKRAVQNFSEF